jgi:UDP-2,4-diacetamido-2,4,6-trideoxy-beta-L-altropyranose hydrolase
MRVAFRVDSSVAIGTGHLKRCLSLAEALGGCGARLALVHRELGLDTVPLLAAAGFERVIALPRPETGAADQTIAHAHWAGVRQARDQVETAAALAEWRPDWIVVDHYAFDADWHDGVRESLACRILAIDDLGDRKLSAEIVVDHNHAADHSAKHAISQGHYRRLLGGPRYALLAGVYRDAPRYRFDREVRNIGIFMGGADEIGASSVAARACRRAGFGGRIEIAATSANPHLAALRHFAEGDGGTGIALDQPNLAAFFARHDIQIGAGGGATWERFCIGAPSIAAVCAENQLAVLQPLEQLDVLQVSRLEGLEDAIRTMSGCPETRRAYAANSRRLVDGRGCDRIVEEMHSL